VAGFTPAIWESWTNNGYLSVWDRKKDMIKTGGENVASREVEEALYEIDDVAEVRGVRHQPSAVGRSSHCGGLPSRHRSDRGAVHAHARAHSPASSVPSTSSSPTPCPRTQRQDPERTLREQYCDLASGALKGTAPQSLSGEYVMDKFGVCR